MTHTTHKFSGTIQHISLSPHGSPEGIVLEDGTFIKTPPHSVLAKGKFKVGADIEGKGEQVAKKPNAVFHHAQILIDGKIIADDSGSKEEREELKDKHKKEMKNATEAKDEKVSFVGKIISIAVKPKGEVDRFILEDGTSVHIPKEIELTSDDCEIGSEFLIKGKAKVYGKNRFVKAESVKPV